MLFPTKHDHPDQTVIAVSGTMMKYLSRYRVVTYDALGGVIASKQHSRSAGV